MCSILIGCGRKVAWSKVGCIAYITQDGRDVHLSHLRCNPKTGQWEHTGDELLDYISNIYRGRELIHLSWNPSGVELAVVDVFGRLCLFSIVVGLNRIGIIRPCIGEPEDSLNAVVGLMWLNVDRTVCYRQVRASRILTSAQGSTIPSVRESRRSMEIPSLAA